MSVAVKEGYKTVSTGYVPRPFQRDLHLRIRRFNVIVTHRRFGKTVWAINHMIHHALKNNLDRPQYAYLAPTYGQAKRVAWEYLKKYTSTIPGAVANEADLRVDIPRPEKGDFIRFMLLGAENPMALKGIYLDGAVLDEYAEMNPIVWREVIRPTLSDRSGWAIFIGTFRGRNHFYHLYDGATNGFEDEEGKLVLFPDWYGQKLRASETGVLSTEELASAKATMSVEEYQQEFECEADAGMVGAYYSKEIASLERDARIGAVPYDPNLLVETYWDLGINDVMAVWFIQRYGTEFRVFRYQEGPDLSIPEWCKILHGYGYDYDEVTLPHDAAARDLSDGKTRAEKFRLHGFRYRILERTDQLDGIHEVRTVLPRCRFDREKCKRGLQALSHYSRKWDAKTETFSMKPLHNWASNGADAFRTFAMGLVEIKQGQRDFPRQMNNEYNPFTHRGTR